MPRKPQQRGPQRTEKPVDDAERDQIARLHAQGLGRNAISRETGINARRVSYLAKELGLSFVRSTAVTAATEARVVDSKARRAALAQALLADAERLRQQLFAPVTVYNFGGKDNTFETAALTEPSMRDKRDLMASVGMAVDRAVKLDAYDKADEAGSALDLWIAAMSGR